MDHTYILGIIYIVGIIVLVTIPKYFDIFGKSGSENNPMHHHNINQATETYALLTIVWPLVVVIIVTWSPFMIFSLFISLIIKIIQKIIKRISK